MKRTLRVGCLQMSSTADVSQNLGVIEKGVNKAANLDLLALPENFAQMPKHRNELYTEQAGNGEVQTFLRQLAQHHDVTIIAGSLPVVDEQSGVNKPFARCLVISSDGTQSHYDKLHLFDVDVNDAPQGGAQRYRESDRYQAGALTAEQKSVKALKIGANTVRLGASICYDLRFPELYREFALQGVDIITLPSAFTYETGKAHWQLLLRARAVENQAFVIAPAQVGEHANGRRTWGHSMIVDPWGRILAQQSDQTGLFYADLDLNLQEELKTSFPVLKHRRLDS